MKINIMLKRELPLIYTFVGIYAIEYRYRGGWLLYKSTPPKDTWRKSAACFFFGMKVAANKRTWPRFAVFHRHAQASQKHVSRLRKKWSTWLLGLEIHQNLKKPEKSRKYACRLISARRIRIWKPFLKKMTSSHFFKQKLPSQQNFKGL